MSSGQCISDFVGEWYENIYTQHAKEKSEAEWPRGGHVLVAYGFMSVHRVSDPGRLSRKGMRKVCWNVSSCRSLVPVLRLTFKDSRWHCMCARCLLFVASA